MTRMLKGQNYDGTNYTITGLQRIDDADLDNDLIPRILEEFALNSGTGHVVLNAADGDQIGDYTTTWYANNDVGDSLERYEINYTFDDGNNEGWTFDAANFGLKTDRTQSGGYSIGINDGSAPRQLANVIPSDISGGYQIDKLSFWYQETTDSSGSGVRLYDSAGNPVIGVATDNPEWDIEDLNGIEASVHTNPPDWDVTPTYDTWYKVEIQFDWAAGEATIGWFDNNNNVLLAFRNRPLINNTDIEKISIESYNGGSWTSSSAYVWYDTFKIVYRDTALSPSSSTTTLHQIQEPVGSLFFDGTDDYAEVASDADAAGLIPDNITIEFWTRRLSGGDAGSCDLVVDNAFFLRFDNDGSIDARIWTDTDGDSGILSGGTFTYDTWNHGALTYDGSYVRLYINGVLEEKVGHLGALSKVANPLLLGSRSTAGDSLMNGYLADVRIWNYARTEAEINSHINRRLTGDESGLIGYWPLAVNEKDSTSNANDVTITGATWDDIEPGILPSYLLRFDDTDGTLKFLDKTGIHEAIVNRTLDILVDTSATAVGSFRIFQGDTLPTGVDGEWEKIGQFATDKEANGTNSGTTSTIFTLWKKISTLGVLNTNNPIKYEKDLSGLQRISDGEIRKLAIYLHEKILTTGRGLYSLGENAPGTGTWEAVGDSIPDERYDVVDATHYHAYAGARTYSGNYNQNYGSNYVGNYGSNFFQNYSQNYNQNYSANYADEYSYSSNYGGKGGSIGYYTSNYGSNYNSNYGSNYGSNFFENYSRNFGSNYVGTFGGNRKYSGQYSGTTTEQTLQSSKTVQKSFRLWLRIS